MITRRILLPALLASALLLGACGSGTTTPVATAPPTDTNTTSESTVERTDPAEPTDSDTTGGDEAATLRIAWWGSDVRAERTQGAMDLYTESNPNVTFAPEFLSWDAYWEKLSTQAAAKTLPDIMQQDYAKIQQWVDNKNLLDLKPFADDGTLDLGSIDNNAVGGILDGGIYGVSLGTNTFTMVYDPAVAEEAGIEVPESGYTWEQFIKDAETVKDKTGKLSNYLVIGDPKFMIEYSARGRGKTLYAADGKSLGFDDVDIIKDYFELLDEMKDKELFVNYDAAMNVSGFDQNLLATGEAWTEFLWSNQFVALATAAKRDLALTVLPHYEDHAVGTYLKASQLFSVTADSDQAKAAAAFISYFVNDIPANEILLGERGVPISPAVQAALYEKQDPQTQKTYDIVEVATKIVQPIDPPEPERGPEATARAAEIVEEFLYDMIDVDEASQMMFDELNKILSK